ncbi:MAG: hypothetical protein RBS43_04685 [Candidatus Cloacimonas sp.]|nr:hypothetical protein [Candidatus Cloacimonas sp.]
MMLQNLAFTCPYLSSELLPKAIVSTVLIFTGSLTALVIWVILLRRLITLADGKNSLKHIIVWLFPIPVLNLLWIPWAIITSNYLVEKIEDKYFKVNAINSAAGVKILSVPLLILYLFWTVLGLIVWSFLPKQLEHYVIALYVGTVLLCILIVFGFYLAYLAVFVDKFWHLVKNKR